MCGDASHSIPEVPGTVRWGQGGGQGADRNLYKSFIAAAIKDKERVNNVMNDKKIEYCRCGDFETIIVTVRKHERLENLHINISFGPDENMSDCKQNIDVKTDMEELRTMIETEISRLQGKV